MSDRTRAGFTLIEVLLAVVVFAISFGTLLSFVTQNVGALAHTKTELEALALAEERIRQLTEDPAFLPDPGRSDGVFEAPNDYMRWVLEVEPWSVPLPDADKELAATSTIFALPTTDPNAPRPSVRRVVLRVHHEDEDPMSAAPFVVFAVEPPDVPEGLEAGGAAGFDADDEGDTDSSPSGSASGSQRSRRTGPPKIPGGSPFEP